MMDDVRRTWWMILCIEARYNSVPLWHHRPWFPFRNPGSDRAVRLDVLVFPNFTYSMQLNSTRWYQTNSEFVSGLNIVQDMKYMTLEYFPASGKVAYRSDRTWNCFSPEILNLLNKLISSGDQRKMRIEATYLQWVYLFYPHDRPDLNTNSPLFKTRSLVD